VHAAVHGRPLDQPVYAADGGDLIYVRDCGRAIALLQLAGRLSYRTYNVASGRVTTNAELAAPIEAVIPGAAPALRDGRDPGGLGRDIYLDISRLPDRMRATIITLTQGAAGRNTSSTTTTMAQIGRITTRWRSTVRHRQPGSVSSCRTQCTFSGGSRNPKANLSQRSGPGSPGTLVIPEGRERARRRRRSAGR